MTDPVNDLAIASSRMYPREPIFKFNPVSPAFWFHFALADKDLFHAVMDAATTVINTGIEAFHT
jgi:hypothetical protein